MDSSALSKSYECRTPRAPWHCRRIDGEECTINQKTTDITHSDRGFNGRNQVHYRKQNPRCPRTSISIFRITRKLSAIQVNISNESFNTSTCPHGARAAHSPLETFASSRRRTDEPDINFSIQSNHGTHEESRGSCRTQGQSNRFEQSSAPRHQRKSSPGRSSRENSKPTWDFRMRPERRSKSKSIACAPITRIAPTSSAFLPLTRLPDLFALMSVA